MKFTNKDLAKAMGLKVGDRIKVSDMVFEVNGDYLLIDEKNYTHSLLILIGKDFEIVHPKKKLGEKLCKEMVCDNCPLCKITCMYRYYKTLYEVLDNWYERFQDKELYDILKARLDKEVE